ncbi:hypothetical protein [Nocardioides sp. Iso805N]|uniref:hypothetical protein n=1 Tax=Nocardioides sp. Iso805N TaxID=1283287 RepID=UPI00037D5B01|nr:hypothetical protein [Nocardioides sp. Iso805N]
MTKAPWIGLSATLVLIGLAVVVPLATGWQVHARAGSSHGVAPLHALWAPNVGPGTVPSIALALGAVCWAPALAERMPWGRLLLAAYVASLAWLSCLALVDGPAGISRVLGNPDEYLRSARRVGNVHLLLESYISRIPLASTDHWPVHLAGHPPGMVLFFVGLVRLGLGGDLAAGLVVIVLAATLPLAVLVTLRTLDREEVSRRAAPYLVWTPAAVYLAVSADAVMAVVVAWSMACLALASQRPPVRGWPWAAVAGLGFGAAAMMSYGLVLVAVPALALLWAARVWWPIPVVGIVAIGVVLAFAACGFAWWEAYPVLRRRYWDGIASSRPGAYWAWGDLAALALSAGPLVGAGLASTWARRDDDGRDRVVLALVGGAVLAVGLADASQMSRAEVERIWLPFVPWLTLALVSLPDRWRRPALAGQVLTALIVQHLLYTSW